MDQIVLHPLLGPDKKVFHKRASNEHWKAVPCAAIFSPVFCYRALHLRAKNRYFNVNPGYLINHFLALHSAFALMKLHYHSTIPGKLILE